MDPSQTSKIDKFDPVIADGCIILIYRFMYCCNPVFLQTQYICEANTFALTL